jgi:hypothetical protein
VRGWSLAMNPSRSREQQCFRIVRILRGSDRLPYY